MDPATKELVTVLMSGVLAILGSLVTIPLTAKYSRENELEKMLLQSKLDKLSEVTVSQKQNKIERSLNYLHREIKRIKTILANIDKKSL